MMNNFMHVLLHITDKTVV